MFTEKELTYLKSQRLARLATVAPDGQPDVVPIGFEYDGSTFYVSGRDVTRTRKYKNVQAGHGKVALVVDDIQSIDPWRPRGLRVYGTAELVEREGWLGHALYMQITPQVSWSWGIEGAFVHKTVHKGDNTRRDAPANE
jgi:pyridoxamine 5'-phosphate oxidase family protein